LGRARNEDTYESEPRKDEIEQLIEHFNMDPQLAHEGMRRAVDVVEMDSTVDGGKERTVQPPTALRNQLGHLGGGNDQFRR